jgi:adhesin transport system outer membrane protein
MKLISNKYIGDKYGKNKGWLIGLLIVSPVFFSYKANGKDDVIYPVVFDDEKSLNENFLPLKEKEKPKISSKHYEVSSKKNTANKNESTDSDIFKGKSRNKDYLSYYEEERIDLNNGLSEGGGKAIKYQQPSRYYNLRQVIDMAISWHPAIKRSSRDLERIRETINEAMAAYYPSFNVGIQSGLQSNDYGSGNENTNKLKMAAEQVIYDFGKTKYKVRLNKSNALHSENELDKEINNIAYQAVTIYLQVVKYKKLYKIAEEQLIGFNKINKIAKLRSELGASAESDYSQSKVRLASAVALLNDYKAQYNRWSSALDNITNAHVSKSILVEFPVLDNDICLNSLENINNSPAILAAKSQIEVAESQVNLSNTEFYPSIYLSPFYEYQLDRQGKERRYNSDYNRDKFGVFLDIKVPIYQGGATSSRVRQSEQALYAARYNWDNELYNARSKITEASSQVRNSRLSLDAKINRVKDAVRTRDLYILQYEKLGNRSFSDLINSESEIHQTNIDIINSKYNIISFSVECLYQTGKLTNKERVIKEE